MANQWLIGDQSGSHLCYDLKSWIKHAGFAQLDDAAVMCRQSAVDSLLRLAVAARDDGLEARCRRTWDPDLVRCMFSDRIETPYEADLGILDACASMDPGNDRSFLAQLLQFHVFLKARLHGAKGGFLVWITLLESRIGKSFPMVMWPRFPQRTTFGSKYETHLIGTTNVPQFVPPRSRSGT